MIKRRLPSLNALRAFEAAARTGGFVAAAEELSVTPAAISHQVKGLEDYLGVPLFVRHHRAVELTAAGQRLLPGLNEAFDHMARAVDAARPADSRSVTVTVPPSFAAKWLGPRLERFLARHPDVSVKIQADSRVLDLAVEDADLAVRFSTGPGLVSDRMFEDKVFPVCSPILRAGLKVPSNLGAQTLIYDELMEGMTGTHGIAGWDGWMTAAGVGGLKARNTLYYSHTTLVLDAAVRGLGVALGRGCLIATEIAAGTLVRPFERTIPVGRSYMLVRPDRPLRAGPAAFREWFLEEVRIFRESNADLVI